MRLGVFGRGRLARAVSEGAALGSGDAQVCWLAGRGEEPPATRVDAVLDCSVGEAVAGHLGWALDRGTDLVIAATGWRIDDLEARIGSEIGVVVAPNGSLTMALFTRLARLLGAFAATQHGDRAGGFLLDHHHGAKVDAPSGTALRLRRAWREGCGGEVPLDVACLRAGHEVGRHGLGLDAPGEQLELVHRARSRAPFAAGLLEAARWVRGRPGLHTMDDVAAAALDPLFRSAG